MKYHHNGDRKPYPSVEFIVGLVCASVMYLVIVLFALFLVSKVLPHSPERPLPSQYTNTVEEETGIRVGDSNETPL